MKLSSQADFLACNRLGIVLSAWDFSCVFLSLIAQALSTVTFVWHVLRLLPAQTPRVAQHAQRLTLFGTSPYPFHNPLVGSAIGNLGLILDYSMYSI
ncbi:hypothetical protein B0T09DRAFT_331236 [Sordaria sp. MPI-SDFR-AT-0083]|nr:hypothetical protein B0T09DRAFT_331236 [Sordaria sp. MPI-SDFR-AT-0083]